jgi:hypothetical protein
MCEEIIQAYFPVFLQWTFSIEFYVHQQTLSACLIELLFTYINSGSTDVYLTCYMWVQKITE